MIASKSARIWLVLPLVCLLRYPLGAAEPARGDWPVQRGTPSATASAAWTANTSDLRQWTFRGRPMQAFRPGVPVWASPALAVVQQRPMLFIGGCDQTMHALDLASRRRAWFKITNGCIYDAPVVGGVDGRPVVFWGSSDRFVSAHSASDGKLLWTRQLVEPTNTQGETCIPSPFYEDGVLYVTSFVYDKALARNRQESCLFALEGGTGRVLWSQQLPHGRVNAPIGCRVDGRLHLLIAARKGLLQALRVSPQGASLAWTFQMPHEVLGTPSVLTEPQEAPVVFLGSKFGDLIALDARTGRQRWRRMTGNWVDNSACCGVVDDRPMVFVGSNDYSLYALGADDGSLIWRRPLGGEVYSAPCLFTHQGRPLVAAACLDNRLYVVDAGTGQIEVAFYTGAPLWDKISKGETLWGSPVALVAGTTAAIAHGSYDGNVYLLPVEGENRFAVAAQGDAGVWIGLAVVGLVFISVILPTVLLRGRAELESR